MFRIYLQHFPWVFLMYNTTSCLYSLYCITEHQNSFNQYRWNSVALHNLSSSWVSSYSCHFSVLFSISMIATFRCYMWARSGNICIAIPALFLLLHCFTIPSTLSQITKFHYVCYCMAFYCIYVSCFFFKICSSNDKTSRLIPYLDCWLCLLCTP